MRAPIRTIESARRLRRTMSLPEVQLWTAIRKRNLGRRFRRQHPVGPYVLDFYVSEARLAIEVDGMAHDCEDHPQRDIARDAWLTAQGIQVLRFNAAEILNPTLRESVLATIAAALASSPVQRGRGTAGGGGGGAGL